MNVYKQIYKEIKKANKIVIARHIGPDPDALGSSLGLKELILNTFPEKQVYVIGNPTNKFKFMGTLDKIDEDTKDALLIVTDTPDLKRIDGANPKEFKRSIKIDHHPYIQKTCTLEWIDDSASSACQMVAELAFKAKLKINKTAAELLYTGIIADTNRFMFAYTRPETFKTAAKLLEITNLDITKVYNNLYMRPYKDIKFQGFLSQNFIINEDKVGYIIIDDKILHEYGVDVATPGNMINSFNHIKEMLIWVTFTYDKEAKTYRTSIRSRGPIVNEVASHFGGGGHIYASGVRIKDEENMQKLIEELSKVSRDYINSEQNIL